MFKFSLRHQIFLQDNNWHLFALTVEFVILSLTGEDTISHAKFERIKEFHVGGGWFRDGAKGNWRLADSLAPRSVQILDWYHAVEYSADCARAEFGERADLPGDAGPS